MTKPDWQNKSLVVIIAVCFSANLLLGWAGYLFWQAASVAQVLLFQVGVAFAISGAVMAGRALFSLVYVNVLRSGSYFGSLLAAGYAVLQVPEMLWGVYLFKDWQRVAADTAQGAARQ